ncbi:MAG: hypothetical protein ACLFR0_06830 [Alphaproteobacteria bacterium]
MSIKFDFTKANPSLAGNTLHLNEVIVNSESSPAELKTALVAFSLAITGRHDLDINVRSVIAHGYRQGAEEIAQKINIITNE